ncbi:MAG: hypothetical protein WAT43_00405 [Chitinophagales bacterium]
MERKEFLIKTWYYFFRPIIILCVLLFWVQFIINSLSQNGFERFISLLIAFFILLTMALHLISRLFKKIVTGIQVKLTNNTLTIVKLLGKVLYHFLQICMGMAIVYLWKEEQYLEILLVLFSMVKTLIPKKREKLINN